MQFICLGSSSKGNSYVLRASNGESLVLECGVKIQELKKVLDYDLSKVVGAFATHMHLDHIGRINEYCKFGIDVYLEFDTFNNIKGRFGESHRFLSYNKNITFNIGLFKILGFPVYHDVPTVGFLIQHPEMGKMVFLTDTKYSNFNFPRLNHVVIEANYSLDIMNERLINGSLNGYLKNRVTDSHMELGVTKEFLKANDLSNVRNVILIHLSDENSDEHRFIKEVKDLTGKPTFVADAGRTFNLSLNPF